MIGTRAMMLAAGLGTRMRPLTLTRPKPLIEVAGRSLLDRGVDALQRAGVSQVVVNKHYLADQIDGWAAARATPHIVVQDEEALILDTGGGVAKALPHLGPDPFFVLNSDSFWVDGPAPALQRMRDAWNDATMDCLLLLARKNHSTGFDGPGDFDMDDTGRLARRSGETAEHVYAGAYLVHPRLFRDAPGGAFSMNELWNRALAEGRLHGLVHDGWWL
ncbi:MAG: nucleotidyltransferase family protein, partial [Anderseniella sp.]|nr:nucleotidyltransferase family protein [Anderseniella sp.]